MLFRNTYSSGFCIFLMCFLFLSHHLFAKVYTSGGTIKQYDGPLEASDNDQKVLRLGLVVINGGGTAACTGMVFNITGGSTQILNAELHYTGTDSNYVSPSVLSTATPSGGLLTFTTFSQSNDAAANTYYYWLVIDVVGVASFDAAGTKIDCSYNTGTYGGGTPTFNTTNPIGFRWTSRYYKIGSTAAEQYATVSDAAAAVSRFNYDGNTVIFMELTGNYASTAETAVITFTTHTGPAVIIFRPAVTGRITAYAPATNTAFITFNGVQKIKFDGRVNGGDGSIQWTIQNTRTSATVANTFHFINDASNDTLTYLNIEGDANNAAFLDGIIHFGTTTGTTGNDNNTISYCKIGNYDTPATLPNTGIKSTGTAAKTNSGNIIDNCEFYDIWGSTTASANNICIYLDANTTGWTITNNHFYKTSGSTFGNFIYNAIIIGINTGGGYVITGNYLGGQGKYCSGGSFAVSSTAVPGYVFYGIYIGSPVTGSAITISNNVISNISVTSTYDGTDFGFQAIRMSNTDGTVAFTANGNRIGATSGTDSLIFTHNGGTAGSKGISGIDFRGAGTCSIANNTLGAISLKGTRADATTSMINVTATATVTATIDNNTIGNITSQNIRTESNSILRGINTESVTAIVTNNFVQNFYNNTTGTTHDISGIRHTAGTYTCTENTIQNLSTTSRLAGTAVYGISSSSASTGQIISSNIVQNNAVATTTVSVSHIRGIYVSDAASGGVLKKNFVSGLTNTSTSTSAQIGGLLIDAGSWDAHNNVVILDNGANTNPVIIRGIEDNSTAGTEIFYHNTVKISGTPGASAVSTAAFRKSSASTGSSTIKNNIFQNLRTGSPHYAYDAANTTGLTTDYNYLEVAASQTVIGNWGGVNYNFTDWKSQGGTNNDNDKNSTQDIDIDGHPLPLPWYTNVFFVNNPGYDLFAGGYVIDDKDGASRDSKPWMGAFEGEQPLPIELLVFTATPTTPKGVALHWLTASETGNDYFTVLRSKNALDFEEALRVKGAGFSSTMQDYSALDTEPLPGVSYYRLKQTDYDGASVLSNIIAVRYDASGNTVVEVYPNPAFESNFNFNITAPQGKQLFVTLYDLNGKELYSRSIALNGESFVHEPVPVATLPQGVYLLTVKDDFNVWNKKIIVQ